MTSCSNSGPVAKLGYGYHIIPVCPYVDTQLILVLSCFELSTRTYEHIAMYRRDITYNKQHHQLQLQPLGAFSCHIILPSTVRC